MPRPNICWKSTLDFVGRAMTIESITGISIPNTSKLLVKKGRKYETVIVKLFYLFPR